ncbi:hypothetical protein EAM_0733 [Erwinia amylovora ATCC 49946]|nr:hypothetical protein BEI72_10475 [Erwinia amylovora]CBJ45408.1 hypothetical protein EAM_0733 [Erwinia amylovora ATCC 49946]
MPPDACFQLFTNTRRSCACNRVTTPADHALTDFISFHIIAVRPRSVQHKQPFIITCRGSLLMSHPLPPEDVMVAVSLT